MFVCFYDVLFILLQAILIGKEGSMVNTIRDEAAADIEELFGCSVNLTLHVKK